MRGITAVVLASALVACGGAANDDAPEAAGAMEIPGIALADVAGTWNMVSMADTVAVPYILMATDSETGWTVAFPDREPIPIEVAMVDGDSIVTITGPFESMLYEGEMVTTPLGHETG